MTRSEPADLKGLVRAFYEPFRTGDTAIHRDVLAIGWVDLPLAPGQQPGAAGLAAQIETFRHAFPDYDVVNEDLLVDGDRVAVRNTVTGTHRGAFLGHPPTGRRIAIRTMDVHRVRAGRIDTTWHLEDFAGLMSQVTAQGDAAAGAWD
ncbi:hypothetical protein GCM10011512_21210 [Tersicoccus solisilvae]|uniref:Ester cyclase n=1 Tax=Tersicoccus solisilvae TaxID=1882339 RepID=A0ABQ1P9Q3_9MICC|nr:ester cyclase [Tersicoccus solisilvae]GGC93932.1 hypothetical protein GCM10011512_21210 [Tersicoccus solisilvae]